MRTLARHGGDIFPLLLSVATLIAILCVSDGVLGMERWILYQGVALSAVGGFYGLLRMARAPAGKYPSVFLLGMIYQKVCLFAFWQIAAIITYTIPPQEVDFSQGIGFVFLLASSMTIMGVNLILFTGAFVTGFLEEETDPVPLRELVRLLRRRRR